MDILYVRASQTIVESSRLANRDTNVASAQNRLHPANERFVHREIRRQLRMSPDGKWACSTAERLVPMIGYLGLVFPNKLPKHWGVSRSVACC